MLDPIWYQLVLAVRVKRNLIKDSYGFWVGRRINKIVSHQKTVRNYRKNMCDLGKVALWGRLKRNRCMVLWNQTEKKNGKGVVNVGLIIVIMPERKVWSEKQKELRSSLSPRWPSTTRSFSCGATFRRWGSCLCSWAPKRCQVGRVQLRENLKIHKNMDLVRRNDFLRIAKAQKYRKKMSEEGFGTAMNFTNGLYQSNLQNKSHT